MTEKTRVANSALAAGTVSDLLSAMAGRCGDRAAYIYEGRRYSFREVEAASAALANQFIRLGIGKTDRIAIIALNQIEWVIAFFAAARIGAVVVGLNVRYRETELDTMLEDSAAKAVISLPDYGGFSYRQYFSDRRARLPNLRHHLFLGEEEPGTISFSALMKTQDAIPSNATASMHVSPDDLLMIIYTSGTTGIPKAAGLSHRSALQSAWAQSRHIGATEDDLIQLANPLNHVGGITCGILTFLLAGGCCELVPVFKADIVLDLMSRNPPTMISGVPTMLTLLLMSPMIEEVNLDSVRLVFTGGSNVDETLLIRLGQKLRNARLMNLYGLTESSGAIVMTPWDAGRDDLLKSIGKPLEGAEARVVLANGNEAARNEIGELWFRGLGIVKGYVGSRPDAGSFDGDGWLHTSDLGYMDERGYIFLLGRSKDMFIQGGFNVYPAEVENLISTHPDVVLVAGIGVPDPVLGEVGRYYVVRKDGSSLGEQDIVDFCRQRLADYKVPKQVMFRPSLPMTPAGKIHKAALRAE